ncbi:hypothetical protein OROGR_010964 [Orobanche gracilis]
MADGDRVSVATVRSIFVYPIKSCRGLSLPEAPISSTGVSVGSAMASGELRRQDILKELNQSLLLFKWNFQVKHFLPWIGAPGMSVLKVSLAKSREKVEGVSVWEWTGSVIDEGADASQWFSNYLGKPSRLVRFNDASEVRNVDPDYAGGYKVMFADGYPYLLLSQGSLNALNALLKEPISASRFRPNILVDGCEPFSEDLWTDIRINKATFRGVKLCSRCKVPTINQETAVGGSEPTKTLMSFRSDRVLRPDKKKPQGKVYFGQNMVCNDTVSEGNRKSIKVGDPIFVLNMVPSAADAAA